jgi:Domain of unknown function (DUF4287)
MKGGSMGRPTFKAYMENIKTKSGKGPEDFWKLAVKKGYVKHGKMVGKHGELLEWLKSDIGLGHVHANFIILYLRLRAEDPDVSAQGRKWAHSSGFKKPE